MNAALTIILAILSFFLGACPFSVWIGRSALRKDIRKYGDGNPGAANVFRTGSKFWGIMALVADILKGMPFILIARLVFGLPQGSLYVIALSAILGHAYTPFLEFRGGKALAVSAGALLAIPLWDMVITFVILLLIGFLLIENDSWTVLISCVGSLLYLVISRADIMEIIFIACLLILFSIKQYRDLKKWPPHQGRLVNWLRSKRKAA